MPTTCIGNSGMFIENVLDNKKVAIKNKKNSGGYRCFPGKGILIGFFKKNATNFEKGKHWSCQTAHSSDQFHLISCC
jgi:hypothetical protein